MDETVLSVFFLFPFLFRLANCGIAESSHLSPVKPLLDGATLISSGGIFELGFFSPGRSHNRYVGIWYHDFSPSTVLWVANRESPVPNTSGSLSISGDGNLVVLDGDGAVLWSSKAASFFSNSSTAELLDTGNFILKYSGSVLWQSFDHPTDTYLPGMKIGLDLTTNVNQVFTSWRSQNDPAPGKFTLGVAPDQSTQFFIWEDGRPRWRSGRWDGQVFIGIQGMVPTYIYGFKLSNVEQEKKMYFYYTAFNSSHRYVLMPDGVERHLVWENDTANWRQFWAQPVTKCELYNTCGDNAACSDGNPPACACLKGFERRSGGCMRRARLQCQKKGIGEKDEFFLMTGVKLPDFSVWVAEPADWSQCEAACLRNCSCEAFSYVTGIGCLVWWRDLTDIRLFATGGNDFHLRLAASEFDDRKGLTAHIIVIIVFSALFSVGGFFFLYKCKSRIKDIYRKRIKKSKNFVDRSRSVGAPSVIGFSSVIDIQEHGKGENEVRLFSFQIIEEATMNFCSSNLLGEGGFGPVYKGILPMGEEIAVKRLSRSSGQGMEEFKNEVILIAKLQHRNLVRLLGYCIRREDKMLVYEYMPNKSLDALLLADPSRKLQLDWNMRYHIIEGIARGLIYLHRDSRLRIIHRDMKASNILLDENMNPKISDFGMARIFGNDANETSTKRVVGTYGYMSPEYAMHGLFSVKSDVYSFGVLILEIVSGIRNSTYYNSEVSLNLLGYAWKLWNEDNVMELVDSSIRSSCPIWEVSKCVNVGLLCIQDRANDRPTMSSVIVMLESENSVQPVPKQPKFAADMNKSETNSILHSAKSSITMLVGR